MARQGSTPNGSTTKVGRLQIPVHDALLVGSLEPLGDLHGPWGASSTRRSPDAPHYEGARLRWISDEIDYARGSGSLDFGNQYTGWDGSTDKTTGTGSDWGSYWVTGAATIGTLIFTYETLEAMGFQNMSSRWYLGVAGLGGPHTEWDRVHFKHVIGDNGTFRLNQRAIPHEYGHVLHNYLHSDEPHYWGEVTGYAKEHSLCVPTFFNFAHYEGYGNAIRDLVWRYHDAANEEGRGPADRCAGVAPRGMPDGTIPDEGSLVEANVADFYYSLVYGHEDSVVARQVGDSREDTEGYLYYQAPAGDESYWLFPPSELATVVRAAGSNSHNLHDMWDNVLRERCGESRDFIERGNVRWDRVRYQFRVRTQYTVAE